MPVTVTRDRSLAAVEAALQGDRVLVVFTHNPSENSPYNIGTKVTIQSSQKGPNGLQVVLEGRERVRLVKLEAESARVQTLPLPEDEGPVVAALQRNVLELLRQVLPQVQEPPAPLALAYLVGQLLHLEVSRAQPILEASTHLEALELTYRALIYELEVQRVRQRMGKDQKEFVLRQQLKAIQDELGDEDDELQSLEEKLKSADLPEEVRKEAERELKRLSRMNAASPDHSLTRTYLELLAELPWKAVTEDVHDLGRARQVLDADHLGLEKVKQRILEHLAVMKLNAGSRAPILLLVGPPGVGKTSLGQSIAQALGRRFERMSLGGLHDEAELRGHRRTYVGAMPGRLIQALRRAGVKNPVLMMDEVDKMGQSFRGDPAAALLEIIDPAQNDKFRDNYLDLPFDLSQVVFVLTANSTDSIPRPLLDRMEVIRISGYTHQEKVEIARRYLWPRVLEQTGLGPVDLSSGQLDTAISQYTREAGVRELERTLARLARKLAVQVASSAESEEAPSGLVLPEDLSSILGPPRFLPESARTQSLPGVSTGLAWTEAGGDVLYIEALAIPASPGLTLTGQLGEVMQESARAAQSFILSRFPRPIKDLRREGMHIHVPAGAIPKDGPSAGVAMAMALLSAHLGQPVRAGLAMTGEITLTGLVLPVGGIKEKLLAAKRAGCTDVILPKDNRKDLVEVEVDLNIHWVTHLEEAFELAFPELRGQRSAA
jgi:ATP-dependent Lon protease